MNGMYLGKNRGTKRAGSVGDRGPSSTRGDSEAGPQTRR